MCNIKYDRVMDVLQIVDKPYNSKKVDFIKVFPEGPLYLIAEKDIVIGLEYVGFKCCVREFYKEKKKELSLNNQTQAEEFLKGSLYNLYKMEFKGNKLRKEPHREITITVRSKAMKDNIKDLCYA